MYMIFGVMQSKLTINMALLRNVMLKSDMFHLVEVRPTQMREQNGSVITDLLFLLPSV
jgi:hypothetical protein